jgi:alpha-L-fucosidase
MKRLGNVCRKPEKFRMTDFFFGLCLIGAVYLIQMQSTVAHLAPRGPDAKYSATWESLDTRPLPKWYPRAKFGIFIHWGLFSVPGVGRGAEQFWGNWINEGNERKQEQKRAYVKEYLPPRFKFQDFAPQFKAEFYKPKEWVRLFRDAGARLVKR